jgi:threonine/homoserine/homoserine lactone efflux protein
MDVRHLIAYGLIVLIALLVLGGGTMFARKRSAKRRIRRGWQPPVKRPAR